MSKRIRRSPDNATTDLAGASDRSTSDKFDDFGQFFGQLPTPYQHLRTMFGLAMTASVLMLVSLPIYFSGSTDVDTQTQRQARYRVDINCPRWAEFANLPMVGEKTAKAIVEHGQAIGGFGSVNQLVEVKGVGAKTLAKIQPFLVHSNENEMTQQREVPNSLLSRD